MLIITGTRVSRSPEPAVECTHPPGGAPTHNEKPKAEYWVYQGWVSSKTPFNMSMHFTKPEPEGTKKSSRGDRPL